MRVAGWIIAGALTLGGCATVPASKPAAGPAPKPFAGTQGLQQVMGQNARTLTMLFGQPALDVREFNARKLQFAGGSCVLDAYLYAKKKGQEPVVTHVDARRTDGADVDKAACVASLSRK
ncbi:hypothetical protein [Sphingomonas cavernae]|uniref:Uncharacterized protein n=1 Tax=Sphingomonas cavernae TaxID=2320861 RepID=A0A418WQJ8_9SPHN|nr:hypothetical protein [Sphingomonas cavernae]RJF93528.1 hypothetical protein D3876_04195 [Sphingomonas cavernae]